MNLAQYPGTRRLNLTRVLLIGQRTTLTKRGRRNTGLNELMGEVAEEHEQADSRAVMLNTIKAGIAAHRATLAA